MTAAATSTDNGDWISEHTTLIISVVSVVFSAFVGPSITGWLSTGRERRKDHRALVVARREDLRAVLDEAAKALSGAVTKLRPLLAAQERQEALPSAPAEFLSSLVPLGQRLRLRLPDGHPVIAAYDVAQNALVALESAAVSQEAWNTAVTKFEEKRKRFLDAGRIALHEGITDKTEI
jgi:hypothetical protein